MCATREGVAAWNGMNLAASNNNDRIWGTYTSDGWKTTVVCSQANFLTLTGAAAAATALISLI